MDLSEHKILITGGSSGIGFATAAQLQKAGAAVAINGRNTEKLAAAAEKLGVPGIPGDVSKEGDAQRIVQLAQAKLEGLTGLINNAGYGYIAPLLEVKADEFEAVWRTNVLGATLMAREAARYFVDQNFGDIINVASTAALRGFPAGSPYNATKFGLRGMTEAWRSELREHNIRVMLINPSEVMTNFADEVVSPQARARKDYTDKEKATKLRGDEIAHTIVSMLAMDRRGFITEATVFATNPQK